MGKMQFYFLSLWLLFAAAVTAAVIGNRSPDYVPRSLEKMLRHLDLVKHLRSTPENAYSKRDLRDRCVEACEVLLRAMPSDIELPGTSSYVTNKASYWAQQQSSLSPACFVTAKDENSVAKVIAVSREMNCPFAARSGGNSDVPGASNDQGGIVIDMRAFSDVVLSQDKKIASVGTGAKWMSVFETLDKSEVTVVGGRAARVGVGGLLLGGGMSFISGLHGFACDNVKRYVIMMADGQVLDVEYESHPQLYYALRGGGNNFGVLLRFDLYTYEIRKIWGGMRLYGIEAKSAINKGLAAYNENAKRDPNLGVITGFLVRGGQSYATVILTYAKPEPNPPIAESSFKELLEKYKPRVDTMRLANMTEFAIEIGKGSPPGFRQQFTTLTLKNSAEIQDTMVDIFLEEVEKIKDKVSDPGNFAPIIAFQALTTAVTSKFSKYGGNALGVSGKDGPLILINLCFQWSKVEDDKLVLPAIEQVLERTKEKARKQGLLHPYLYMNYAAPFQKPISSYGRKNVKKLREAQNRYDPKKVFETLVPGGFKLNQ